MTDTELPFAVKKLRRMNAEVSTLTAKLKAAEEALSAITYSNDKVSMIKTAKVALKAIRSEK